MSSIQFRTFVVLVFMALSGALAQAEAQEPPETRDDQRHLSVFSIEHADAEVVFQVLQTMMLGSENLRMTVDHRSNSVIVLGTQRHLDTIQEIIEKIVQESRHAQVAPPPVTYRIRIVWLMTGLETSQPGTAAIPQEVLDEIQGRTDAELKIAGQLEIPTTGHFNLSAMPFVGEPRRQGMMRAVGSATEHSDSHFEMELELRFSVQSQPSRGFGDAPPPELMVDLQTALAAEFGKHLVLGIAPTGDQTSVVVITVTQQP